MDRFISSVRQSVENQNWFGALFLALALPDICAALENPDASVGTRYKNWFNAYLKGKYAADNMYEMIKANHPETIERMGGMAESMKSTPVNDAVKFTAEDCYRSRCRCLHQGFVEKNDGEGFMFTSPPPNGNRVHCNSINGLLQIQIDIFCEDICSAVENWLQSVSENKEVNKRIDELLTINNYKELEPAIKIES